MNTKFKGDEWYKNPDRKCLGDARFIRVDSPRVAEKLIYLCLNCPVIKPCYQDALTNEHREKTVQGGEWWREDSDDGSN